jgi:hypothetical protein
MTSMLMMPGAAAAGGEDKLIAQERDGLHMVVRSEALLDGVEKRLMAL